MKLAGQTRSFDAKERIIIALDVDTADAARGLVNELKGQAGAFKIGLQLFAAAGPSLVREFTTADHRIFLDLKFHDIPNTVAKAAVEAARLGVWMFNVHAAGGSEMMQRAFGEMSAACEREDLTRPLMIAVTVLTSSGPETLAETGTDAEVDRQVARLSGLAARSGLDGVVASAREVRLIRRDVSSELLIVTPGVRPDSATNDDQKRVMTPTAAIEAGADHLVIGRPVTAAADRQNALQQILAEVSRAADGHTNLS